MVDFPNAKRLTLEVAGDRAKLAEVEIGGITWLLVPCVVVVMDVVVVVLYRSTITSVVSAGTAALRDVPAKDWHAGIKVNR